MMSERWLYLATRRALWGLSLSGLVLTFPTACFLIPASAECGGRLTTHSPDCVGEVEVQPDGRSSVAIPGGLDASADDIVVYGALKADPSASTASDSVVAGLKVLTPKGDLLHLRLTLDATDSPRVWSAVVEVDPAHIRDASMLASAAPVGLGSLAFDSQGNFEAWSASTLQIAYSSSYGAGTQRLKVVPAALYVRPGVPSSQLGLAPLASESSVPMGATGELVAGAYAMPVAFLDNNSSYRQGVVILSRDLDQQATALAQFQPLEWRMGFIWDDPSITLNDPRFHRDIPTDLGAPLFLDPSGRYLPQADLTLDEVRSEVGVVLRGNGFRPVVFIAEPSIQGQKVAALQVTAAE